MYNNLIIAQVMEAGEIVECGHPHELLQQDEGHFSRMVKQLGPAAELSLRALAEEAHQRHLRRIDEQRLS